jgi:hypothetical protein
MLQQDAEHAAGENDAHDEHRPFFIGGFENLKRGRFG